MTIRGTLPWNSLDRHIDYGYIPSNGYSSPSQEEIDKCLSCPYDDCYNCFSVSGHRLKFQNFKIIYQDHKDLNAKELAELAGIAKTTAYAFIRRIKKSEREMENNHESD